MILIAEASIQARIAVPAGMAKSAGMRNLGSLFIPFESPARVSHRLCTPLITLMAATIGTASWAGIA